jgi:hypothetical protein
MEDIRYPGNLTEADLREEHASFYDKGFWNRTREGILMSDFRVTRHRIDS